MPGVIAIRVPRPDKGRTREAGDRRRLEPAMVSSLPASAADIAHFRGPGALLGSRQTGPSIASSALMRSFVDELVAQVEEGIRVLRIRDGLALTEAQVHERAANIV